MQKPGHSHIHCWWPVCSQKCSTRASTFSVCSGDRRVLWPTADGQKAWPRVMAQGPSPLNLRVQCSPPGHVDVCGCLAFAPSCSTFVCRSLQCLRVVEAAAKVDAGWSHAEVKHKHVNALRGAQARRKVKSCMHVPVAESGDSQSVARFHDCPACIVTAKGNTWRTAGALGQAHDCLIRVPLFRAGSG